MEGYNGTCPFDKMFKTRNWNFKLLNINNLKAATKPDALVSQKNLKLFQLK